VNREINRSRVLRGIILLIGAISCASLRNISEVGISPFVITAIEGLIFICLLAAARFSCWQMAAVIGAVVPLYLWGLGFMDGFMVPVSILVNLVLTFCMYLLQKKSRSYWLGVLMLTTIGFAVLFFGSTAAIWIVKREHISRTMLEAWNTHFYSLFSLLGASAVCAAPYKKTGK